jgi:hypothetical protein
MIQNNAARKLQGMQCFAVRNCYGIFQVMTENRGEVVLNILCK